jgi:hypothetical protein
MKNRKMLKHTDDISVFVRFSYNEELTEQYVYDKLVKAGVVLPER